MIGIDLFAGAGGMSLGAAMAGINVKVSIENDKHAIATYARNHPSTRIYANDITQINDFDLDFGMGPKVLFGGPPCQGFSTSNQKTRSSHNPTNWLFGEFIRMVGLSEPDWVVFENVKGILETENAKFFHYTYDSLKKLGYLMDHAVLNAADFGVPQFRNRLFIIGNKRKKPVLPIAVQKDKVCVWDAIADLPELANGASENILKYRTEPASEYAKIMRGDLGECSNHYVTNNACHIVQRYKHIPQGGNWESIPPELMANYTDRSRCHTGIYRRLNAKEPSVVIGNYRKNMLIHPFQDRGLSVREAARLQSFPDWYIFEGSIGFQQQQVGNAVPPLLARAIFEYIVSVS